MVGRLWVLCSPLCWVWDDGYNCSSPPMGVDPVLDHPLLGLGDRLPHLFPTLQNCSTNNPVLSMDLQLSLGQDCLQCILPSYLNRSPVHFSPMCVMLLPNFLESEELTGGHTLFLLEGVGYFQSHWVDQGGCLGGLLGLRHFPHSPHLFTFSLQNILVPLRLLLGSDLSEVQVPRLSSFRGCTFTVFLSRPPSPELDQFLPGFFDFLIKPGFGSTTTLGLRHLSTAPSTMHFSRISVTWSQFLAFTASCHSSSLASLLVWAGTWTFSQLALL